MTRWERYGLEVVGVQTGFGSCAVCGKSATGSINIDVHAAPGLGLGPSRDRFEPRCAEHNPYHFVSDPAITLDERLARLHENTPGRSRYGRIRDYWGRRDFTLSTDEDRRLVMDDLRFLLAECRHWHTETRVFAGYFRDQMRRKRNLSSLLRECHERRQALERVVEAARRVSESVDSADADEANLLRALDDALDGLGADQP